VGATPAPANLWGELQPADSGTLPLNRNSTAFNDIRGDQYNAFPWFTGIDTENGYLFTSLAYGVQIWDTRTNPANPSPLGTLPWTQFNPWVDSAEDKWPLVAVDAPAGDDTIAAAVGHSGIGIAIVDFTNKNTPRLLYQNSKKVGEEVYAATLGGSQYAFMAASGGNPSGGLYMYNMTKARQFSGCSESIPAPGDPTVCPGVFLGTLGNRNPAKYVHGVDNYVVVSSGPLRGFDVWDVSNPASPQLKLAALSGQTVYGVAMWKDGGGHYYVAMRNDSQGQIYDVSCIAGTCGGPVSPIWTQTLDSGASNFFVTFSRGGATPFLYFGSDNRCAGGSQREWLFDVTNPAAPHDLTPPTGYWGWYYRGSPTGFNYVMPRRGKFNGSYFYRTALSLMDVHQRTGGVPPLADFSWTPNPAYSGAANAVTFHDLSSGAPILHSTWTFAGSAGPSIASATDNSNPVVTFSSPGTATVTLTTTNAAGISAPVTKTVTVASPIPAVTSVTVAPNPAFICQTVTFTANGVTGQPAPTLSWVLNKGGVPVAPQPALGSAAAANWDTSAAVAGNDYTATVTATNVAGTASQTSVALNLQAPPALPTAGAFSPTYDGQPADPLAGTVIYHVNVPGAAAWNWDFGDGLGFRGYVTDPVLGPNPAAVTYTMLGIKPVRVLVKNCVAPERQSAVLSVNITQITPLLASFHTNLFCQFGQCFTSIGVPVTFTDFSTGAQFWDYDWSHTGSNTATCNFTDSNHTTPVLAHTFTSQGTFQPCLRVRRGASEQDVKLALDQSGNNTAILNVTSANPPSISIFGPTTGQVGQSLGFSATALNCDANTGTWSWTMTGGTPSSGSGSAVTVSYGAAGVYSVTATNSNCAGATGGFLSVNVSSITTGGDLAAAFTFSPGTPNPGQAVSFDGSASTGGPSQYSWNFGDNGNTSGATASHTFAGAGTYPVTLTVTKAGTGPGCFSGICANALTKNVVVGGGTLAAAFTFSPGAPNVGQAVSFDAGTSTGSPTQYSWSFGDGSNGTGVTASHSYAGAGTYSVTLTVSAPGTGTDCSSGTCVNQVTKTVTVTPPPLDASFTSSAQCVLQFGFNQCNAQTGDTVTLTATTTQATTYSWDFGDGSTASGRAVSHAWAKAGPYTVRLTVANAQTSANQSTSFVITGETRVAVSPVVLPWVAQSRGVLTQSSDLYIHNPGSAPIDVTLEFRKRGTPDVNPPRATRTIQPGQTLFAADVLGSLFSRENLTGFISLVVSKGDTTPIITSYNTISHADGTQFGLALGGVSMSSLSPSAAQAGTSVQHLVGMNDNSDRTAVFGITNPSAGVATYHLTFFDNQGRAIGHPSDVVLSPYGQRQFQVREIRSTFGISATDDYRVKIETADGSQFFPYDSDLRNGSSDPAYFPAATGKSSKVYLLGAMSTPDGSGSVWKTDVVLTNTTDQPVTTTMTFTRIGLRSTPEHSISVTLGSGETKRLADVVADQWKLSNVAGVLTLNTAGASGVYPIVQGESYDDAHAFQFGQAMAAFTDGDAAGADKVHYLVGLRQNSSYRSQLWLFNPGTEGGSYDLVYRGLDGTILGRINNFIVGPGSIRQIRPVDHPIPAAGVTGGFTVQIVVHTGKVLAAGQVINIRTNDPAYVSGKTQ